MIETKTFMEGIHYIRPFGGRKILYIWERIEKDMAQATDVNQLIAGLQWGTRNV